MRTAMRGYGCGHARSRWAHAPRLTHTHATRRTERDRRSSPCLRATTGKFSYARQAISDYRRAHNLSTTIRFLPNTYDPMAYWFRCRPGALKHKNSRAPQTCREA